MLDHFRRWVLWVGPVRQIRRKGWDLYIYSVPWVEPVRQIRLRRI